MTFKKLLYVFPEKQKKKEKKKESKKKKKKEGENFILWNYC